MASVHCLLKSSNMLLKDLAIMHKRLHVNIPNHICSKQISPHVPENNILSMCHNVNSTTPHACPALPQIAVQVLELSEVL